MWISLVIFVVTYGLIIWDRLDRMVVALSGAVLMIIFRIISQETAFKEIDLNTIGLLIGMMIIVMVTKRTGVFEYLALKMVKAAKGEPFRIIILLGLVTGILSAFLDNVTTILLILPITLSVSRDLKITPIPFLIAEVFASNVGGTATLIGDPPNIIIGSATGFTFGDFLINNGPVILPLLLITSAAFALLYKKKLTASEEVKAEVLSLDEKTFIKDKKLLIKSILVLVGVIAGFLFHGVLHYDSATIAMAGGVLLLLISGIRAEKIIHEVEWKTIFFFVGLFIMVGGLKETGIIQIMAEQVLKLTEGNPTLATLGILWVSALASAFVDNIPFVTTMVPLIKELGVISGMDTTPLWWALSLGACLGGNGTIVGASANVIAVGMAEELGYKITFRKFFRVAFPLMLFTIVVASGFLVARYS
ncbi:MAG TPA: ArsB/NhaD family transporter [Bacillota bacterium]|nr:ArsB/NhaD family transporter [Bacillota bacterium]